MRYHLLVKGTTEQATSAAVNRGVSVVCANKPVSGLNVDTCALFVVDSENDALIVAWFVEPSQVIPSFGYPAGTLLHYAAARYSVELGSASPIGY